MPPENKIIQGLKHALKHAKCDHEWLLEDVVEYQATRRIELHCPWCNTRETRFEMIEEAKK